MSRRVRPGLLILFLGLILAFAPAAAPREAGPYDDWAAAVVAGDWRAGNGKPTPAFDNARRDVAAALVRAGFSPANVHQFSPEPRESGVLETEPRAFVDDFTQLSAKAQGGCLLYFTSHGSPEGIVFGKAHTMPPKAMGALVDQACGTRPTVVVVSACYSGVFVPAVEGPNRMVLTAARRDRTSFGCGENDRYPWFDECVLETLPRSRDFARLAEGVRTCVALREKREKLTPSEPQLSIGGGLKPLLPLYELTGGGSRRASG